MTFRKHHWDTPGSAQHNASSHSETDKWVMNANSVGIPFKGRKAINFGNKDWG